MKKARIKVSRFDENDVIATSGYCTLECDHYFAKDAQDDSALMDIYRYYPGTASFVRDGEEVFTAGPSYFGGVESFEQDKWYTDSGLCEIQNHRCQ